jgi:hypothetical protein
MYFYLSYAALFELRPTLFELRRTLFELRCTLFELRCTLFELRRGEETYMAGEIQLVLRLARTYKDRTSRNVIQVLSD